MNSDSKSDSKNSSVDPITLEVIRHGLVSITDQIDANISRTAFSPYIYEYKDFAVGLVSPEGELVAQCTGGMPVFVADSVGMAVRDGLTVYGRSRLHRGDVLVCNHAAVQGQHLNNTVMYTPVFAGKDLETLIGFFAINVHWIDIGGITPRSSDIFMEGLQPLVEGRTDSRSLSDHREQYAVPGGTPGRHRRAARRLCARPGLDATIGR
jgi:N-methylhydantoinase B